MKAPNMVRVTTFNDKRKLHDERTIDTNKAESRNWLIKHIGWATRSSYGVQVEAE